MPCASHVPTTSSFSSLSSPHRLVVYQHLAARERGVEAASGAKQAALSVPLRLHTAVLSAMPYLYGSFTLWHALHYSTALLTASPNFMPWLQP